MHLLQERVHGRDFVNTVMNLRVSYGTHLNGCKFLLNGSAPCNYLFLNMKLGLSLHGRKY